uniref:Uncharacterized protein n=1 Tax=Tanacetum cinerariifolium TaxID=118510 RepID=A0A6L2LRK3_TANCI|nr:hypothetical protein [Tanacetum cinerariifolium]
MLFPDSNPDKDPKEDPEEDHADYPADGGDGDDQPSDDDGDDADTDDEDDEPFEDEEEEHLATADSSVVPIVDPVPPAGDTEAFETDDFAPTPRSPQTIISFSQTHLRRAQKTTRLKPPTSASIDRPFHHSTILLLDREATYAREAWAWSKDRSAIIEAHVRTLEAHVATLIALSSSLQTQLTTSLGHIEILKARDPEPQEGPAEASSSC